MSEIGPENRGHPVDENRMMLIENGMAALSNLSFVDTFPRFLLIGEGLETLCKIIRSEEDIPLSEEEDGPLLRNILQSVGVTIGQAEEKDCPIYSLHQVTKMNFENTEKLVAQMLTRTSQELLLNTRDGADMTPL